MSPYNKQRGFTLMELMIVVVIMGILATVATYGVRRYIQSSKTVEAREVIGSIKAAEEQFVDETFRYLDVTGKSGFADNSTLYPSSDLNGKVKIQWGADSSSCSGCLGRFQTLGITVGQPVMFRYGATSGLASDSLPQPDTKLNLSTFGNPTPTGPWYLVKAVSDLDNSGDGVYSIFVSSSFQADIYEQSAGE